MSGIYPRLQGPLPLDFSPGKPASFAETWFLPGWRVRSIHPEWSLSSPFTYINAMQGKEDHSFFSSDHIDSAENLLSVKRLARLFKNPTIFRVKPNMGERSIVVDCVQVQAAQEMGAFGGAKLVVCQDFGANLVS